ncbi:4'-phosphopantetheinyl transferase family protein [Acinetobacter pittii]|uniref:4'-phosphopantetheinyl transferase family protein n=1 Tax=Acinetobacter pittii TaxID=48296 RepID=UPI003019E81E
MSGRAQVQVYVCPVSRVPQDHMVLSHYLGFLSSAEKLRYDQYHPKVARLFLISRVLTKFVLADKLGVSPHEVIIQLQPNGKPFVQGNKVVYFNLSHSADVIILAVTEEEGEIGVDVERVDREFEWRRVDSVLAPSEIDWIKEKELTDSSSVYQRFFQIWTLKEAYIKCTGEGMSRHLKKLNFHVLPEHIQFLDSTNDARKTEEYYFQSYVYDHNFIFSICLQQSHSLERFNLDCFQLLPFISTHRITPTPCKYG